MPVVKKMIDTKTTIPPLQFLPFPKAPANDQYRLIGWLNGRIIYWGRKIDEISLWSRQLSMYGTRIFLGVLMLFGAFGLGLGIYRALEVLSADFSLAVLWQDRAPEYLFFWVSALVDMYVYYYFVWKNQQRRAIRREPPVPLSQAQADWSLINKTPSNKWQEISSLFSRDAHKEIEEAVSLASRLGHGLVLPLHVLAVSLSHKSVGLMFARLGVVPSAVVSRVNRKLKALPQSAPATAAFSETMHQLLLGAYEEAYKRRAEQVEITDVFTATMKTGRDAQAILYDLDIELDELRNVVMWITIQGALKKHLKRYRSRARFKPKGSMNRAMTAIATPYLDRFSQDLTQLAKNGLLDYCVNREFEIESIFQAVEAGNNGVVLVGNPGVGRKTIIAGIAERMVSEDAPPIFQDKRLVSISLSALIAGAKATGELEERLLRILSEVSRSGNIIIYIEDIHNMVGITTEEGSGLDLSEVFSEFLNKKAYIVLSSSNPTEYRRYLETTALGESLHRIRVDEMETDQTIHVLEAKSGFIEYQQRVFFSYESVAAIVKFAKRYLYERFFPEKAIQLMEEVASFVRRTRGKKNIVTAEDVAQVVAAKVKVPVTKVTEKEGAKLMQLEERIHQRLVDQSEAVKMVASALRRARAELRDIKKPIVNLLFLGPTGVGKTELSKTVAEVYFGSEKNMIRIDMSEYQEKKSIDRLIGAPPGMTEGAEGGYLTEAVRRTPFSLLLLDEIEKAHPDILNLFLQVLDDGRLTDSLGRTIDFTNTIIIATSNAGTSLIQQRVREGLPIEKIRDELVNKELSKHFRPEFLNRFDGIMVFKPLSKDELFQIAELLLNQVAQRLEAKGIMLKATPEAIKELVKEGYDPAFGARPLRRVIQNKVDNALANYLLQGRLSRRDVAILEPGGVIRVEKAESL